MSQEEIIKVKSLLTKALEGTLSLNELFESWDEEWDDNVFLNQVFDDLESAVEHLPGKLFSGKADMQRLSNSTQCSQLKIDLEMMDLLH